MLLDNREMIAAGIISPGELRGMALTEPIAAYHGRSPQPACGATLLEAPSWRRPFPRQQRFLGGRHHEVLGKISEAGGRCVRSGASQWRKTIERIRRRAFACSDANSRRRPRERAAPKAVPGEGERLPADDFLFCLQENDAGKFQMF
jgi:hypothetical protein